MKASYVVTINSEGIHHFLPCHDTTFLGVLRVNNACRIREIVCVDELSTTNGWPSTVSTMYVCELQQSMSLTTTMHLLTG